MKAFTTVRGKLPAGSIKQIAKDLELSEATISQTLRGKTRGARTAKIFKEAAKYAIEVNEAQTEFTQALAI